MFAINEAIQRNLTLDELVRINESWCAEELMRRMQDDPDYVTDISGYWTDCEHDAICRESFNDGRVDGINDGMEEGRENLTAEISEEFALTAKALMGL